MGELSARPIFPSWKILASIERMSSGMMGLKAMWESTSLPRTTPGASSTISSPPSTSLKTQRSVM